MVCGRWGQKGMRWCKQKNYQCYVYMDGKKKIRMSGAYGLVRRWYFKDFTFCQRKKGAKATGAIRQTVEQGKQLGSRVDREILYWASNQELPRKAHRYSKQLVATFTKLDWKPLASQNIVGVPECKFATAFDLLLENKEKELVLVDVKTGYETHWSESNGQTLSRPLQDLPSSSESHSWCQMAVTAIGFIASNFKKTQKRPLKHVAIVRTSAQGVNVYHKPSYFDRLLNDTKQRLLNRSA